MRLNDLSNRRFGRLLIISRHHESPNGKAHWLCKCDCGKTIILGGSVLLKKKRLASCGCADLKILATLQASDAPYAAGFFEGEGAVMIWRLSDKDRSDTKGRRYHRLMVTIAQVDPRPLLWLKERFAGTIIYRRPNPGKNDRGHFTWNLSCSSAADFLRTIRPFLLFKADRVDLALAFQDTMGQVRTRGIQIQTLSEDAFDIREDFRNRLMVLNKRGAA